MAFMKWRGTRKRGRYYASYYEKDKVKGKLLKRWKPLLRDRESASKMFRDLQVNLDRAKAGLSQSRMWQQFLDEYIKWFAKLKHASTVERVSIVFKHLVRLFPIVDLMDITPKLLDDYVVLRKEGGTSPSTINRELSAITKAVKRAKKWGYEVHDLSDVEKLEVPDEEKHCFSPHEIKVMREKSDPLFHMIILMGLYQGFRRGDFLGVRWQDINWDASVVTLGNGWRAKGGKQVTLPLHRKLVAPLKAWQVVCGSPVQVIPWDQTPEKLSEMFTAFLRDCGIEKGTLHSLKHTYITNLKRKKVFGDHARLLGRHEDSRTTDEYTHLEVEDLRECNDRLDFDEPTGAATSGMIESVGAKVDQDDGGKEPQVSVVVSGLVAS